MALHLRSDSLQTRNQILAAATAVAVQGGPQALTMDAVAREAGMSKGGLLYHYPSKEALIKGMMRFHLQGHWQALRREWRADSRLAGRWHRAWIRSSFEAMRHTANVENPALFSMVHSAPELLEFLRRQIERVQKCLGLDGIDPIQSRLLQSSVAGLRYDRMFHFCPVDEATLHALEDRCLELLDQMVQSATGQRV